jgi:hypothetical protein
MRAQYVAEERREPEIGRPEHEGAAGARRDERPHTDEDLHDPHPASPRPRPR